MPPARFSLILIPVIVVAAATIGMAYAFVGSGAPIWFAALGPILLAATVAVHLYRRRQ